MRHAIVRNYLKWPCNMKTFVFGNFMIGFTVTYVYCKFRCEWKEKKFDNSVTNPGHRQFCLYDDIIKMASWHNSRELTAIPKFCPSILSTAFWSLESQFPWKRIDRASIQSIRKWRQFKCAEEIRIRSRTVAPKLSLEWLTCYQAKGNLR